MTKRLTAGLLMALFSVSFVTSTASASSHLPAQSVLSMKTSTQDSYSRYQTIIYAATITRPGTLSHIVMTLPAGATVGTLRSTSGTVEAYKTGQIIWRPASPISVVSGTKLSIPVVGINFQQAGTTDMWLTASTASGYVLTYARGDFVVENSSVGTCQSTGNDYIARENAMSGTPKEQWSIASSSFNPSMFSAFANAESYACGDIAYFKVDSQQTVLATAKVYRMGYYSGAGAREIWSTKDYFLTGKQPLYQIKNSHVSPYYKNMVDASNWNYNLGLRIDGRFTPGTYLVKMSDTAGRETYVPFTVRDETGVQHDFLLQQATTTWQAYNRYGGHSFYSAIPNNASRLSFNRPYGDAEGRGSGEYLQLEYGLVYQMEKEGRDVAYWTDTDLHARASELVARTRTLVLPAHDEYYTPEMRAAVDAAINQNGINVVSFGANQIHRKIAYASGNREFGIANAYHMTSGTDYKNTTFRYLGPSQNEQALLGAQYGCAGHSELITNSSWMFTGIPVGTSLGAFLNGEIDYVNTTERAYGFGYTVPLPSGMTQKSDMMILASVSGIQRCKITTEAQKADIVAFESPAGARVFNGSSFAYGCYVNKTCPSKWMEGPIKADGSYNLIQISDQDSNNAAIIVNNVLNWAKTGSVAPTP